MHTSKKHLIVAWVSKLYIACWLRIASVKRSGSSYTKTTQYVPFVPSTPPPLSKADEAAMEENLTNTYGIRSIYA
jgi:hypothetical protein